MPILQNLQKNREIMLITQEECAEVVQAISKVFRFGMDASHPVTKKTNKESLEEEMGDLLCMIEMMFKQGIVDKEKVYESSLAKESKLAIWSDIYK